MPTTKTSPNSTTSTHYVYVFGPGQNEGNAGMKNLLGGKGANLAEMSRIGVPVPPGFTLTTEACNHYYEKGKDEMIPLFKAQVENALERVEEMLGTKFGDVENPLLLSVRSGARVSMPGMMDTVLNLGLNDTVVEGFAKKMNNPRAAWDSYRRFVQMYGDVVMGLKPTRKEDLDPFEILIDEMKEEKGVDLDTDLTTDDLKELTNRFKKEIKAKTGQDFPEDPWEQLWGAVLAVFDSWMNPRAKTYRRLNGYPSSWGTAVNVQAMVFGNTGNNSATGVAFTRDPATGENVFTGEYLLNAQGEDVVAGIRTPRQITLLGSQRWAKLAKVSEEKRAETYPSLEEQMPEIYAELHAYQEKLERHYKDMQDLEFTIQEGKLWILQTRNGKRTGKAMVKVAMDLLREGDIDEPTALRMIEPHKLDELLHPVFDAEKLEAASPIAQGLPASPGAATGQIVFFAEDAAEWAKAGKTVILVRVETSPEDIEGMDSAKGILTSRGGMTSHAAVVARGMGTCCVSGAGSLHIDYENRTLRVDDLVLGEGDWISLNGTDGQIYGEKIPTITPKVTGDFAELMTLSDRHARLNVRANADTPQDASVALGFGAEGIGLCRTEHMFFEHDRITKIREMILAQDAEGRRTALRALLPHQREDFKGIFSVMEGRKVTIRLLDPPLHEFLPHEPEAQQEVADDLGVSVQAIHDAVEKLSEVNPMMGLRGCRIGNLYPEVTRMQTRAIIEAALHLKQQGKNILPEIMVPLIGAAKEFEAQAKVIRETAEEIFERENDRIEFKVGTMIEIPRAAIVAHEIAEHADFFSFGTNDLTQLTFGYSRDDISDFLPVYLEKGLIPADPFQTVDPKGVGYLVELGTTRGRSAHPGLSVGVCGEHGGDPQSIEFFHKTGLDYVSCSPYRVPIAKVVAAQVNLEK